MRHAGGGWNSNRWRKTCSRPEHREQARLLEQLKAMNQVAEEARQTKQEFIAKVSHELRTPLNMIIAYSELITQSPKLYGRIPPALLADMAVILRNSQHSPSWWTTCSTSARSTPGAWR